MEAVVMSFCGLCLLLVLGKLIRTAVPLLQRLYLPASVIGGILGLVWLNTPLGREASPDWHLNWNALPGFLINIVFASLFIGSKIPKFKTVWNEAAPQLCMGQLIAWGQYVTGLGLALVVLVPLFGVNVAFGNLLEIGFEGGHGTVAGLAGTFRDFGWPEGIALGYTVATVGMVLGIILGMAMINLAVRRGWIRNIRTFEEQTTPERIGIYPKDERPHAGLQTVRSDSIDSLALHIAVIGLAVMIGYGLQRLLAFVNIYMPSGIQDLKVLTSFPLFPLCLIGGLILQKFLTLVKLDSMVSHGQIQRLGGAALDFLVVSAVASIRLDFVATYWMPLLLLVLGGVIWSMERIAFPSPAHEIPDQCDAGGGAGADEVAAVELLQKIAENSGAGGDAAGGRFGDLVFERKRTRLGGNGGVDRPLDRLAGELDHLVLAHFGAAVGTPSGQHADRSAHRDQRHRPAGIEPDTFMEPLPDVLRPQRLHHLFDGERGAAEGVFQAAGADRNFFRKAHEAALEPAHQQRTGPDHETDSGERVERQAFAQGFAHGEKGDPGLLLALEDIERQVRNGAHPVDDQLAVERLADRAGRRHPAAPDAVFGQLAGEIGHHRAERGKIFRRNRTVAEDVIPEVDRSRQRFQQRHFSARGHFEEVEAGRMSPHIDHSRRVRKSAFRLAHCSVLRLRTSWRNPDSG